MLHKILVQHIYLVGDSYVFQPYDPDRRAHCFIKRNTDKIRKDSSFLVVIVTMTWYNINSSF